MFFYSSAGKVIDIYKPEVLPGYGTVLPSVDHSIWKLYFRRTAS